MAVELATAYVSLVPSARGMSAGLKRELGGLDSIADDSGQQAGGGFAGGFAGAAKSGMLAAGVIAAAALAKGFSDGLDQGAAQDKLAAQLGLPEAESQRLGKVAGKLYGEAYGDSLATVNEALRGALQQGLVPKDATNADLESITAKVLDLSTAFDQDLNKTSAAAGTLIKTGLAKDGAEALDILTRGFQTGVDKQGDFLDTLTEYPTLFRNLGLDGKTATGILSQGLQAGARDADKVADALKEFSIRAVDGSKLTAEGFKMIGLNGEEMAAKIAKGGPEAADALQQTIDGLRGIEDPVKRSQAAVALFGTQAEDLGSALFALDPESAADGLGKVGGAAETLGTTLNDNLKTKLEAFKRQGLQRLSEFVVKTLVPAVMIMAAWLGERLPPVIETLRAAFQKVTDWVDANWPTISTVIQSVFATVEALFTGITSAITAVWDTFGNNLLTFLKRSVEPWSQIIGGALEIIRGIIETVTAIIKGDWGKAWDGIKRILSGAWQLIQGVVRQGINTVKLIITSTFEIVRGVVQRAWDGIKTLFSNGVGAVKSLARSGFDAVKGFITRPIEAAKTAVSTIIDGIKALFRGIPGAVSSALSGFASIVSAPFRAAGEAIRSAWNSTVGGKGFSIPSWVPGIGGKEFKIPTLHTGGLVTGPLGSEQLRILEAGEWVLSRAQVSAMTSGKATAPTGTGSGVTFTGPVILQDEVDVDVLTRKLSFAQMAGAL